MWFVYFFFWHWAFWRWGRLWRLPFQPEVPLCKNPRNTSHFFLSLFLSLSRTVYKFRLFSYKNMQLHKKKHQTLKPLSGNRGFCLPCRLVQVAVKSLMPSFCSIAFMALPSMITSYWIAAKDHRYPSLCWIMGNISLGNLEHGIEWKQVVYKHCNG